MLIPLLLIVCFVIFPYIWTFLTSIKPTDELYTTNIKILPRETTFQNYVTLFTSTDFLASMFHSIVIAVITSCNNYPQGRITDHRINYTIYNLAAFMDGDIQDCIDHLIVAENAERLKESEL